MVKMNRTHYHRPSIFDNFFFENSLVVELFFFSVKNVPELQICTKWNTDEAKSILYISMKAQITCYDNFSLTSLNVEFINKFNTFVVAKVVTLNENFNSFTISWQFIIIFFNKEVLNHHPPTNFI